MHRIIKLSLKLVTHDTLNELYSNLGNEFNLYL